MKDSMDRDICLMAAVISIATLFILFVISEALSYLL